MPRRNVPPRCGSCCVVSVFSPPHAVQASAPPVRSAEPAMSLRREMRARTILDQYESVASITS